MKQDTPTSSKWPKSFPPLTTEQQRISHDFMEHWHDTLATKYDFFDQFNHNYVVNNSPANFSRTLEVGAGLGEHLDYERLTPGQRENYVALELRENMAQRIRERFPGIQVLVGDIQKPLDFPDNHFDRIVAIHVLEHLHNLPAAVREMHRLLQKPGGKLFVVIPCEGGLAYSLARKISAQRIFEKRYQQSYDWFIQREHVSTSQEILEELRPYFQIQHRTYFPLLAPFIFCNLVIGLTLSSCFGTPR
jgi:SAM-dependent methyltransferase